MSSSCCPKGLVGGAAARSVSASEWEQEREREKELFESKFTFNTART